MCGAATAASFGHYELVDLFDMAFAGGRPQVRSNFDGRSDGFPPVLTAVTQGNRGK